LNANENDCQSQLRGTVNKYRISPGLPLR
jgi:hypothetical protein